MTDDRASNGAPPDSEVRPAPVVRGDVAPSDYVDYPYWTLHPYGEAGPRMSLTLGRTAWLPPPIGDPSALPQSAVLTAFVATMSPAFLEEMQERIAFVLSEIERQRQGTAESPEGD